MRLLTPDEAAEMLAVPRSTVLAMARGGGLPAVKVGRVWRFPEVALNAWIELRTAYHPRDGEAPASRERGRHDVL